MRFNDPRSCPRQPIRTILVFPFVVTNLFKSNAIPISGPIRDEIILGFAANCFPRKVTVGRTNRQRDAATDPAAVRLGPELGAGNHRGSHQAHHELDPPSHRPTESSFHRARILLHLPLSEERPHAQPPETRRHNIARWPPSDFRARQTTPHHPIGKRSISSKIFT